MASPRPVLPSRHARRPCGHPPARGHRRPRLDEPLRLLAEEPLMIGPGNRLCDVMDAEDETGRRPAITHAGAVAKYATVHHAGDVEAGPAIRKELGEAYGEELGDVIAGVAFTLYLNQMYPNAPD